MQTEHTIEHQLSVEEEERAAIQSEHELEYEPPTQKEVSNKPADSVHNIPLFPASILDDLPTFENYTSAHLGNTEAPLEYHFGVLKCLIGATLGRRVYIKENRPIYPNSYVALIGKSGRARKSHSMSLGFNLIEHADETCFYTKSINSSEGLGNVFGVPFGCNLGLGLPKFGTDEYQKPKGGIAQFITDDDLLQEIMLQTEETEGFRMIAYLDELSHFLLKARNTSVATLIQAIQALYDMPSSVDRLTKSDTQKSPYPCFSLVGASTIEQFHQSISASDIHGGFANRMEYYVVGELDRIAISKPSDQSKLGKVAKVVNSLRRAYRHNTPFEYDDYAISILEQKYNEYCDVIDNEQNQYIASTLGRFDLQAKKNALVFAVVRLAENHDDDTSIHASNCIINGNDVENAYKLQEYLINCAKFLYGDFAETVMGEVHNKIIKAIEKGKHSAAQIVNHTRQDAETIMRALTAMSDAGILITEETKRTVKYHIA